VVSLTSSSGGYINGRNSANLELLIDKTSSIYRYVVLGYNSTYFSNKIQKGKTCYSEEQVISMLEFLIDNIFVSLLCSYCILPSLWFVTGQSTVCYDQVYDLILVKTLYATTKFMICYWSERCMLRPSLWFVTGQNTVWYDQVYYLLLVINLVVTYSVLISNKS
jgi:hypothetical protein